MERVEFDYDLIYKMNWMMAPTLYGKGKTDAFYHQRALELTEWAKRENVKVNVSKKLLESGNYTKDHAERLADFIISPLPEELFQNIFEWIEDKPISEICYHGCSIKKIMDSNKWFGFIHSVIMINNYIKNGYQTQHINTFCETFDNSKL